MDLLGNVFDSNNLPVLEVVLCCTKCGDWVVHWRIYLVVRKSPPLSIRVDMDPCGKDNRYGELKFKEVSYCYSKNYAAGYEMATNYVFGVFWTPTHFRQMLTDHLLDSYYYAPGPSGCRYWCTMVLRCMERVGFVQMGSATGFEQYIYILNSQDPVKYPLPLRKGIFLRMSPEQQLSLMADANRPPWSYLLY